MFYKIILISNHTLKANN